MSQKCDFDERGIHLLGCRACKAFDGVAVQPLPRAEISHVFGLADGSERGYSCPPELAVVCAYAQSRGDWNTWDYEVRYGRLREYGERFVTCGDFTCSMESE